MMDFRALLQAAYFKVRRYLHSSFSATPQLHLQVPYCIYGHGMIAANGWTTFGLWQSDSVHFSACLETSIMTCLSHIRCTRAALLWGYH